MKENVSGCFFSEHSVVDCTAIKIIFIDVVNWKK